MGLYQVDLDVGFIVGHMRRGVRLIELIWVHVGLAIDRIGIKG